MAGKITANFRGTLEDFLEIGRTVPRTIFVGNGDPNSFTFDVDAQPVNGDFFMGDTALWRFDGLAWQLLEGAGVPGSARFPVKILESTVNVPRCEQMTVHGTLCIESTATLEIEGQVVVES